MVFMGDRGLDGGQQCWGTSGKLESEDLALGDPLVSEYILVIQRILILQYSSKRVS